MKKNIATSLLLLLVLCSCATTNSGVDGVLQSKGDFDFFSFDVKESQKVDNSESQTFMQEARNKAKFTNCLMEYYKEISAEHNNLSSDSYSRLLTFQSENIFYQEYESLLAEKRQEGYKSHTLEIKLGILNADNSFTFKSKVYQYLDSDYFMSINGQYDYGTFTIPADKVNLDSVTSKRGTALYNNPLLGRYFVPTSELYKLGNKEYIAIHRRGDEVAGQMHVKDGKLLHLNKKDDMNPYATFHYNFSYDVDFKYDESIFDDVGPMTTTVREYCVAYREMMRAA